MKTLTCVFSLLFFISCENSQEIESISNIELKKILTKENIQLLDVRTPEEVKKGAIKTAVFANFYSDDFSQEASKLLDKNKSVYIYCRSGGRSMKASKILQEKGYKVINVSGGYNQWKQEN